MKTFLNFCIIFLINYAATAHTDVPEGFQYLGRTGKKFLNLLSKLILRVVEFQTGSKTYFWSNTYETFEGARFACKSHSLFLARLETRSELDGLFSLFFNRVPEGYVYVGITLRGAYPIDEESQSYLPYSVVYYPGQPSGSGRCLEIKRYNGGNGLNNILCTDLKRFICERKGETNL